MRHVLAQQLCPGAVLPSRSRHSSRALRRHGGGPPAEPDRASVAATRRRPLEDRARGAGRSRRSRPPRRAVPLYARASRCRLSAATRCPRRATCTQSGDIWHVPECLHVVSRPVAEAIGAEPVASEQHLRCAVRPTRSPPEDVGAGVATSSRPEAVEDGGRSRAVNRVGVRIRRSLLHRPRRDSDRISPAFVIPSTSPRMFPGSWCAATRTTIESTLWARASWCSLHHLRDLVSGRAGRAPGRPRKWRERGRSREHQRERASASGLAPIRSGPGLNVDARN